MFLSSDKGQPLLEPAVHGGINYAELEGLGLEPGEILDFSSNINPYGPPPGLKKALDKVDISSYPDSGSGRLRRALAERLGVETDNIIAGSGSVEIMRLAVLAFFKPGDRVLIIEPAFSEYEVSCRIAGVSPLKYVLRPEENFSFNFSEVSRIAGKYGFAGVFITNPGNPTGKYYSAKVAEKLLGSVEGSIVILDEAYIDFVPKPWLSINLIEKHNILILRSLTKGFALAGLRLGYGVAARSIISRLKKVCPPWNVNTMAQEAGLYALRSDKYLQDSLFQIRREKSRLIKGLESLGLIPLHSNTNFFIIKTGDGNLWRQDLLKHKILVRDCASFGLPEFIRVSVKSREQNDRLLKAIQEINYKETSDE